MMGNTQIRIDEIVCVNQSSLCAVSAAAKAVLRCFDLRSPRVNIFVTSDDGIRALNRKWRNLDEPTDVLSFAAREGLAIVTTSKAEDLGDIAISVDRARSQAQSYQHSEEREMAFLTTHGMLHLLGYDHIGKNEEREMFALQEKILAEINLPR